MRMYQKSIIQVREKERSNRLNDTSDDGHSNDQSENTYQNVTDAAV